MPFLSYNNSNMQNLVNRNQKCRFWKRETTRYQNPPATQHFILMPDLTQFSFENHRVTVIVHYWVYLGMTSYFYEYLQSFQPFVVLDETLNIRLTTSKKIPSEMEVAPRYKLLTLLTPLALLTWFTLLTPLTVDTVYTVDTAHTVYDWNCFTELKH